MDGWMPHFVVQTKSGGHNGSNQRKSPENSVIHGARKLLIALTNATPWSFFSKIKVLKQLKT